MTEGRNPAVSRRPAQWTGSGRQHLRMPLPANEIRQTPLGAISLQALEWDWLRLQSFLVLRQRVVSRSVNRGEKIDGAEAKSQSAATFQSSDEALSSKQVSAASNFSPEESIVIPLLQGLRCVQAKAHENTQWDMTGFHSCSVCWAACSALPSHLQRSHRL